MNDECGMMAAEATAPEGRDGATPEVRDAGEDGSGQSGMTRAKAQGAQSGSGRRTWDRSGFPPARE